MSYHDDQAKSQQTGAGWGQRIPMRSSSMRVDWLDLEDTSWPALQAEGYQATITLQLKTGEERVKWALVSSKMVSGMLANQTSPRFPYIVHDWHVFPLPSFQTETNFKTLKK